MVLGDLWINEAHAQGFEGRDRALLISPDQPRVADYVSGQNGSETALHGILPPAAIVPCVRVDFYGGRMTLECQQVATSRSTIDRPVIPASRVAGGSHPPPAPTERSVRISRTTLFGERFTVQRMPETAGMAGPGVVAVAATAP